MNKKGKSLDRGFSLLEAIIVIGLIGIVAAITLPAFFRSIQGYRAETAVEQIQMNLRFARLSAIKKRYGYQVLFSPDPTNTYEVENNPSKDTVTWLDYTFVDTSLPEGLVILTGGITSVRFNPRGAATITTSGTSTIRIQANISDPPLPGMIYRLTVYPNGHVTKTRE